MVLDKLKQRETKLRPYKLWVASFSQEIVENPVLIKILYNDFPVDPIFITRRITDGEYEVEIENYIEMGIAGNRKYSISGENIVTDPITNRIQTFLNTTHNIIKIRNIDNTLAVAQFNGSFVIFYYDYY